MEIPQMFFISSGLQNVFISSAGGKAKQRHPDGWLECFYFVRWQIFCSYGRTDEIGEEARTPNQGTNSCVLIFIYIL